MQVLIDDAISSVELVNCQRMEVQIRGSVPSVAVDKTDGFLCYLSKESLGTNFVTSKVCFGVHTLGRPILKMGSLQFVILKSGVDRTKARTLPRLRF